MVISWACRVDRLAGLKTLLGFRPKIRDAVGRRPDGLLLHEDLLYSLVPPHAGMRQYGGTSVLGAVGAVGAAPAVVAAVRARRRAGFWHETYFMRGGTEAIYDDVPRPVGWPVRAGGAVVVSRRGAFGVPGIDLPGGAGDASPPAVDAGATRRQDAR